MNERLHATQVLARRRILETVISPGFYVAQSLGLLLAYFLITGFTRSVDSGGFDFRLYPVYELIGRSLVGAFGATFVEKLFAEGPFLFILYVAFLPVLLYLAVSSVFRFGLEKKVGALELITYGPADGSSYFLASLIKDVLLTLLSLAVLLVFLLIAATVNNLILGPTFYVNLAMLFLLAASVYAYGVISSTLTDNSASAIALFAGLMLFFLIVLMGSFTIVSGYVRNLASVFAWVVKWISPLFYWDLGVGAAEVGAWGLYGLSLVLLAVLSAAILFLSHLILKVRGVRP
jgi:hypothetical protein